jgi:hypothetical protein
MGYGEKGVRGCRGENAGEGVWTGNGGSPVINEIAGARGPRV